MALPIGVTPVLKGKEATKFLTKIHEDEQKPARLIPTPKLDEACELIKRHAKQQQNPCPYKLEPRGMLLTDDEVRQLEAQQREDEGLSPDDYLAWLDPERVAKAHLKKVVDWGNEWCGEHIVEESDGYRVILARHQCCECWRTLEAEIRDGS